MTAFKIRYVFDKKGDTFVLETYRTRDGEEEVRECRSLCVEEYSLPMKL